MTAEKRCPDCAEYVAAAAAKCRHCGYRWSGRDQAGSVPFDPWRVFWIVVILFMLGLAIATS